MFPRILTVLNTEYYGAYDTPYKRTASIRGNISRFGVYRV